jgi:hypothetical protein
MRLFLGKSALFAHHLSRWQGVLSLQMIAHHSMVHPGKLRRGRPDGRLGLCAFLELFLNYSSYPFPVLSLPSR